MNIRNRRYDFLIVGAGLFGATFARLATDRGYTCLVVEKRPVTGGNIRCESIENINVHRYGAHIFHTSDPTVWNFVNSYVKFNRFTNSPVALFDGKLYNLPFNMNTFYALWGCTTPAQAMERLERERSEAAVKLKASGVTEPRNLEEQALLLVGKDIYSKLISGYTRKQWGRPCDELPAFIIRRLPVRLTFDNNYFNDTYQGIPEGGYNLLIEKLLKGSEVVTDCDFFEHRSRLSHIANKIIFTGNIDRYFDYRYGPLAYRSVRFEDEILDTPNYQGVAVVNYTDSEPAWTRIIEHKHFEMFGDAVYANPRTVISREYSAEWHEGMEPFYPVNDKLNNELYEKYRELAAQEKNVWFGGRLAEYKYYDMSPTVARAMALAKELTRR
ncbi:MAG: UDP-galactopyranose mutase [Muribaculaceae bacterium]|nr:UDP-galactopyranose mutase [Muribaculaceae bacterium]